MSDLAKIVFDTNNLVSSQINKQGPSFQIFNLLKKGQLSIYTSPFQLKEFERVLNYPRIRIKYKLSPAKIKKVVNLVKKLCAIVYPLEIPEAVKNDNDDNHILAIASEAKVDCVVSGDKHLLDLKNWHEVTILTAQQYWKQIKS